jgi:hypothetical protein
VRVVGHRVSRTPHSFGWGREATRKCFQYRHLRRIDDAAVSPDYCGRDRGRAAQCVQSRQIATPTNWLRKKPASGHCRKTGSREVAFANHEPEPGSTMQEKIFVARGNCPKTCRPHAPRGCFSAVRLFGKRNLSVWRLARTLVRLACTWLRFEGTFMPFIRRLGEHYFAGNASLQWR